MAPVFALVEIAAALVIVLATANSLGKRQATFAWWTVFFFVCVAGIALGVWFGFLFSYRLSPRITVYSFPVPGAFHVFETYSDGSSQWTDFITPAPLLSAVANALFFLGLAVAPVWLANVLTARRRRLAKLSLDQRVRTQATICEDESPTKI